MEVLDALDRDLISELRAREAFFWLDLEGPAPAEVDALGESFGFDPFAIEDTKEFGQRPKLLTSPGRVLPAIEDEVEALEEAILEAIARARARTSCACG